jgi:Tol biopolymer transport system component
MDAEIAERRSRRARALRWSIALATVVALAGGSTALVAAILGAGHPLVHPPAAADRRTIGREEATSWIVFASDFGGRYHIHEIHPDGTGEVALTSGEADEKTPAWSPARDRIAFVRGSGEPGSAERRTHIYVMGADGTGVRRITDGAGSESDPAWSPDGARLAFTARDPATAWTRIGVAAVGGTDSTELSAPPRGCSDQEPAWSPDGRSIAFARRCGGEPSSLFVMEVDGTALRLLTAFGRTPSWSPDGARIAYTGMSSQGAAIYVIGVDGSGKVQLTTESSGDPVWSPDGRRIAFTRNVLVALKLFVINLDGSGLRALTAGTTNEVEASW